MNVAEHISNDVKPLGLNEVVREVLDLMEELKFCHLPVVEENNGYLGLICEDDLLEVENEEQKLSEVARFLKPYSVPIDSHIFNVVKVAGEGQLSLVPIIDQNEVYRGYISPLELVQDLGGQLSFKEEGGVLVLQIPSIDYQLSQIVQIVESEDARIIGFWLMSSDETDSIDVVLKINQKDLGRIVKSFERYSYNIKQVFHTSMFDDSAHQRYESLMKYLDI
jgi:predicted transcriptional regulator